MTDDGVPGVANSPGTGAGSSPVGFSLQGVTPVRGLQMLKHFPCAHASCKHTLLLLIYRPYTL